MIEVIFVVHAEGKVATIGGTVETVPEAGEIITVRGQEHKVLHVNKTYPGNTQKLPMPEIYVEPVL